jgi:hypothetical protein
LHHLYVAVLLRFAWKHIMDGMSPQQFFAAALASHVQHRVAWALEAG